MNLHSLLPDDGAKTLLPNNLVSWDFMAPFALLFRFYLQIYLAMIKPKPHEKNYKFIS